MTALTKKQKAVICQMARRAWDDLTLAEHQRSDYTTWRRAQQAQACGKESLRCCTQRDYLALMAHFLSRSGDPSSAGRAFEFALKSQTEGHRIVRHKIAEALRQRGLADAYAEALAQRIHRAPLAELAEKQLWQVLYTIRNRRKPTPITQ